ncbi:MAG: ABC transporter ATP-binding protein [bacterium]|nr:ABC transporter ATP-binding protein [bacterium]MCP4800243.1 ABC transporter ATP-binding protein [bacterium]
MPKALDIKHLRLTLDHKDIVSDVSLAVDPGGYMAIVGPNGAGKTSILKCIAGIHSYTGSIAVAGNNLEDLSAKKRAQRIAYVPQAGGRTAPFTCRELVAMSRYPHKTVMSGLSKRDAEIVDEKMELTTIAGFADRQLDTLSGGERQKVFLAAALAQEADLLLLDEPTTFLDPSTRYEMRKLLKQINRKLGVTVIEVTHDLNDVVLVADKIYGIRDGKTAFFGSPKMLMKKSELEKLYNHSFVLAPHPDNGISMILPEAGEL